MARWRKPPAAQGSPAVAEITQWLEILERYGGPPEMLAAARSWLAMLGPRPDPEVADLFAEMARVDRAVWLGAGGG